MLRNVNVRGPYVVTFLNPTFMCEWHVTRVVDSTRHQHETCYNESGLCDQMINIIVGLIVNTIKEKTYVITLKEKRVFS